MEFRDFCLIFIRRWTLFIGVFVGCVATALLIFRFQPERFETSLTLNVTRTGMQETQDYTYDQFYRLQADERFADTVVRWLSAPSVRSDIRESSGVAARISDTIDAKRLSSQMIDVTYESSTYGGFGTMAVAIPEALNREAEKLNTLSKDVDWFTVMADEPVVRDARLTLGFLLALGTAIGMFLGFWVVLADWYFRGTVEERIPQKPHRT
ncbi:MAG: hypothetical protein HGB34_01145 [Candidatus Moranbacteria bacterium]|nr:hypothetical protein [Candidatus Moranbacteria bacterium]